MVKHLFLYQIFFRLRREQYLYGKKSEKNTAKHRLCLSGMKRDADSIIFHSTVTYINHSHLYTVLVFLFLLFRLKFDHTSSQMFHWIRLTVSEIVEPS